MKSVKAVVYGCTIVFIAITISLFSYWNSDLYYAKQLINAIQVGDVQRASAIITEKPGALNTYPTFAPKWWQSAMNTRVVYPLTQACIEGDLRMIQLLVDSGANINCNDGVTPLSTALRYKAGDWYSIAQYLVDNGAQLNYKTDYSGQNTSILCDILEARSYDVAQSYGKECNDEIEKFFLLALSNCDFNNVDWSKVLQHSVSYDRVGIIRILVEGNYCNINLQNESGMTALMFAARDATIETVDLLLQYGADKSVMDNNGFTALDYAKNRNDLAILLALS